MGKIAIVGTMLQRISFYAICYPMTDIFPYLRITPIFGFSLGRRKSTNRVILKVVTFERNQKLDPHNIR
jgi:hypothetical protein